MWHCRIELALVIWIPISNIETSRVGYFSSQENKQLFFRTKPGQISLQATLQSTITPPGSLSRRVGRWAFLPLERGQVSLERVQQTARGLRQVGDVALVYAHVLGHLQVKTI